MNKPIATHDDEIDLIELLLLFWSHRLKYLSLGLVGLAVGLVFTYQQVPRFTTDFMFTLNHPIITNDILMASTEIQRVLNRSELNQDVLPHLSFNKRTDVFTIISAAPAIEAMITAQFRDALAKITQEIVSTASSLGKFNADQAILSGNATPYWSNQNIAQLSVTKVTDGLVISFGKTKVLTPNLKKFGALGIFVGLGLAFAWMLISLLIIQLRSRR